MNKFLHVITWILIANSIVISQCDYSIPKYSVASDKKLLYGVMPDYRGIQDSLYLDVYYPVGSIEAQKPLVILAFGGGFFQGTRQDIASFCEEMAKRGFVAATIDYRLGFDGPSAGFNPPFAYDAAEVIRAGYRGLTDMKGAIRFMKGKHDVYGIDINRVWIGGFSAGSILSVNCAFLNDETEKPKEAGAISPIGAKPRPDLGPVDGTLNINGFNSNVQGVFNFFGALFDTTEIDLRKHIALFTYHQTNDPVVACDANVPYASIPFISSNYPVIYGGCVITDRLKHLNYDSLYWESWIYPGNQHDVHDVNAVLEFMTVNANPLLCKSISSTNEQTNSLEHIDVYPNPAVNSLIIRNIELNATYLICNLSGFTIKEGKLQNENTIDISEIPAGMYFIRLKTDAGSLTIKWLKL